MRLYSTEMLQSTSSTTLKCVVVMSLKWSYQSGVAKQKVLVAEGEWSFSKLATTSDQQWDKITFHLLCYYHANMI